MPTQPKLFLNRTLRAFVITYFIILLSASVSAQEPSVADSIYFYRQSSQQMEAIKWGIAQLLAHPTEKLSALALHHHYQNGKFKMAQQATKTDDLAFNANGVSSINRFKLYGYFSFNRTWQDSLAYSQKGLEDAYQPYYYYAGKASVFERQTYLGGGIISYALLKNRLYLGTGVDYLYHSSAGSVDPRSLTTTFNLKFSPQLAYRTENAIYGLAVAIGYGDELIDISYKNSDFQGSTLYPDRISYLNYGYGYSLPSQNGFMRKNHQTGISANYVLSLSNWNLNARLSYAIDQQDNQYPKSNSINNETFGIYQLETYKADLLLNQNNDKIDQQFLLSLKQENGDDELIEQAARNYTFKANTFQLMYSNHVHKKPKKTSMEWFSVLGYRDVYVRDAAVDHTVNYGYLYPKLGGRLYFKSVAQDLFAIQLGFGARLPLHNEVEVPATQVKYFTQGVVYHDHLYWASKVGETQLQINYVTKKLISNFKTGFSLQSTYYHNFHTPASTFNSRSVPGKRLLDLNLKINLYF